MFIVSELAVMGVSSVVDVLMGRHFKGEEFCTTLHAFNPLTPMMPIGVIVGTVH